MLITNGQFYPLVLKHSALIYIDDILLFLGTQDDHRHLLNQFVDIIQSHGIMLSAKKSNIGHYQPGTHTLSRPESFQKANPAVPRYY